MQASEVLKRIQSLENARGKEHWKERGAASGLKSFGVGLTQLRQVAKDIGRDRDLAMELWKSNVYEMRVISLLIDDPKEITQEQVESQVDQLAGGLLAHVFSSCDATLAKTPFAVEVCDRWIRGKDSIRKQCGYGLLYEISKYKGKKGPDDAFFLDHLERIDREFSQQSGSIQMAMGASLLGIGKRNPTLNAAALKIVRKTGPIEQDNGCEPFDVEKHLVAAFAKK